MGIAAYNRGSAAIARDCAAEPRPAEFEIMDRLNAIPKKATAVAPFRVGKPITLEPGNGGFWLTCPITGRGYWYRTLRDAVSPWLIDVTGYDATRSAWLCEPRA